MGSPLLFAGDSSIDEVSAESYNIETEAMIDALDDIAKEEEVINAEIAVVLD
jgi:hypothetical protein